jgi:hypothetical protein
MNSSTKPESPDKLKATITITGVPEIAHMGSSMSSLGLALSFEATIKVGKGVIFDGHISVCTYECMYSEEEPLLFSTSEGDYDMQSLLEIVCRGTDEETYEKVKWAIYNAVDDTIEELFAKCNRTFKRDFSNTGSKKTRGEKHSVSHAEKKVADRSMQV